MAGIEEIRVAVLEPMRSLYRVPFGIEDPEAALSEYAKALTRFSGDALRAGWARTVEGHKKRDWPSIADLLSAARAFEASNVIALPARPTSSGPVHEARITPAAEMVGFLFRKADGLRKNPTWVRFLDSIHPTMEHCFFARATMTALAHDIQGLSAFEAQYIRQSFGEQLKAVFGCHVVIRETGRQPA